MKNSELLHLAALLHDIGKFRMRRPKQSGQHQEHSYEFVNKDFEEFFSPCGEIFKDAIRHHHPSRYPNIHPTELEHLIEKQVIVADRLSATERAAEDRTGEHYTRSPLVSIPSRLKGKGSKKEYRYALRELTITRETIIPDESVEVNQQVYNTLWETFIDTFGKAAKAQQHYTPTFYQTLVALLHKYTARIPSATASGAGAERTIPDISLYDHLRTTAAIAACIGRELSETEEVDAQLSRKNPGKKIGMLIKGDISGIQNFLYHILSDGAARQLRGRSFYLQLLTEAIAHWVLRRFDLPITNLLLASGGHFYILAPYTEAREKLDALRQKISKTLWELHSGDLSCNLADIPLTTADFSAEKFSGKWKSVSEKVQHRKQKKWSELGPPDMFENLFEPYQNTSNDWGFDELGTKLREAKYLVAFEVPESPVPEKRNWRAAMRTFGWDVHICTGTDEKPVVPAEAERSIVYRLGDTELLAGVEKYQWDALPVSYDFKVFQQVIPYRYDTNNEERVADYDYLANASDGVQWLGALRMDVDDLGKVFSEKKLENATISRLATLSESLRLFFEGYVPQLCREYNKKHDKEILELIYAGGDDLFIVGGWSALPEIAELIRSEFRQFITGDHVTLSGGIAIEHKKFPLYQFADRSGRAEDAAKGLKKKNAITFLQKPMAWADFEIARDWHRKFLNAMHAERDRLPTAFLTRLNQIYADKERWAWRSLYYFNRIQERYRAQKTFLHELQHALNLETSFQLKEFIHVITRWTGFTHQRQGGLKWEIILRKINEIHVVSRVTHYPLMSLKRVGRHS